MYKVTPEKMRLLDFPNHDIAEMVIDTSRKEIALNVDFGWLDVEEGIWLENCVITLSDWEKLEVTLYPLAGPGKQLNKDNLEELADICVFDYGENIVFEGAPKHNSGWLKYNFIGAKMVVEFEKISIK